MKKNKGVSLISLVVTIILILIIASISVYYGISKNIDRTTESVASTEIFDISEAVSQRALMNRLNSSAYPLIGEPLTDAEPITISGVNYGDNWYKVEDNDFSDLSLENIKNSYIVNYETSIVVSLTPIYYNETTYYASDELKKAITGVDATVSSDMYDSIKGVNKPVIVKGMLPVKNMNGVWIITTVDDEEWYDYSSENKIWANVMLTDEITVAGFSNEEVRAATLSELEGKAVTNNGSMFVWIPRYSTNSLGEIVYSYLLNDYTDDGFSVSEAFKDGYLNQTGIWISKYDVEYK